jgi:ferredoxin
MKLLHKATECIGCGVCTEVAPHYFEMNAEGLAHLHDATRESVFHCTEALPADVELLRRAEKECPVAIIHLG